MVFILIKNQAISNENNLMSHSHPAMRDSLFNNNKHKYASAPLRVKSLSTPCQVRTWLYHEKLHNITKCETFH
jgi:hypothetical protein